MMETKRAPQSSFHDKNLIKNSGSASQRLLGSPVNELQCPIEMTYSFCCRNPELTQEIAKDREAYLCGFRSHIAFEASLILPKECLFSDFLFLKKQYIAWSLAGFFDWIHCADHHETFIITCTRSLIKERTVVRGFLDSNNKKTVDDL